MKKSKDIIVHITETTLNELINAVNAAKEDSAKNVYNAVVKSIKVESEYDPIKFTIDLDINRESHQESLNFKLTEIVSFK